VGLSKEMKNGLTYVRLVYIQDWSIGQPESLLGRWLGKVTQLYPPSEGSLAEA